MILDTSFLIALDENDPRAEEVATEAEIDGRPIRVPTPVVHEIYTAVGAGTEPILNQRKYEALLANKPVVGLDQGDARRSGIIYGEHLVSDTKPELSRVDAMVVSIALGMSEPLVGRDSDFSHVDIDGFELIAI
ncbi:hypothetical protein BRD04_08815 [Halobacteriales archaeon QS_9_67_17]|nr:MAG: hypothetical protein BRD04_08815 [Halobacteriales archaeon QS_9_67_17]